MDCNNLYSTTPTVENTVTPCNDEFISTDCISLFSPGDTTRLIELDAEAGDYLSTIITTLDDILFQLRSRIAALELRLDNL